MVNFIFLISQILANMEELWVESQSYLVPVYQTNLAGFWYKRKWIKKAAFKAGFSKVSFHNSWADYRSRAICEK